MKLTTVLLCSVLIVCGVCAGVFALSGFNLLLFLCFYNTVAYRIVLSLAGIAALWLVFWLIVFRPTRPLS